VRLPRWLDRLHGESADRAPGSPGVRHRALDRVTPEAFPIEAQFAAVMGHLGGRSLNGAVERARALIPSIVAQLSLVTYFEGRPAQPRSPVAARPDPFATPYDFVHESIASLVDTGDAFWRLTADIDGHPTVATVLEPAEVHVSWNENRTRRRYSWRDLELEPGRDIAHIRLSPRVGELRGSTWRDSPALASLLAADAYAVAVYQAGGIPPAVLETDQALTAAEAGRLREEWVTARRTNPGAPGVTPYGLRYRPIQLTPAEAQLLETRRYGVTEVARLAGIPGALLLAELSGSSLTYQNVAQVKLEFASVTLAPMYLAPVEAAFSDLLPRGWAVRFDLDELFRADMPTRWETWKLGVEGGWVSISEVRASEGLGGPAPITAPAPPRATVPDPYLEVPT